MNARAVKRYEEATSCGCELTLATDDGCLLSNHDRIGDVLASGDVIMARLESRVEQKLKHKYISNCQLLAVGRC